MLQPKFKLPAIVLVLVLVSLITLVVPSSPAVIPALMLTAFTCLFIGFITDILSNTAVTLNRHSTLNETLNELARPFYKVMSFILPLRLNTRDEEMGALMARRHENPLPGMLLMRNCGVMKRSLLEE